MTEGSRGRDGGTREDREGRRRYSAPELVDYGPIARLTAGGSGAVVEGMAMTSLTKHP